MLSLIAVINLQICGAIVTSSSPAMNSIPILMKCFTSYNSSSSPERITCRLQQIRNTRRPIGSITLAIAPTTAEPSINGKLPLSRKVFSTVLKPKLIASRISPKVFSTISPESFLGSSKVRKNSAILANIPPFEVSPSSEASSLPASVGLSATAADGWLVSADCGFEGAAVCPVMLPAAAAPAPATPPPTARAMLQRSSMATRTAKTDLTADRIIRSPPSPGSSSWLQRGR